MAFAQVAIRFSTQWAKDYVMFDSIYTFCVLIRQQGNQLDDVYFANNIAS